jgi:ankyrin repeat protein
MHAIRGSSAAAVELLVHAGADVGRANRHGTLALHMAAWYGTDVDTVRLLLRSGAAAQIDMKNNHGYTPAAIAAEKGRTDLTALFREFPCSLS